MQRVVVLFFCLSILATTALSQDGVVQKSNPKKYRYSSKAQIRDIPQKGAVIYMAYPGSNDFQDVEYTRIPPSKIMSIPGNEFDKCVEVRLSPSDAAPDGSIEVALEFIVTLYQWEFDFSKITAFYEYDVTSEMYKRYTSADDAPLINPEHPEIAAAAHMIREKSKDPLDYVRNAYIWAKYNEIREPGAAGFSACSPQANTVGLAGTDAVFVSLVRKEGIPARINVGRGVDRYIRMWAEFYLEKHGWIPVSPSVEKRLHLDDFKLFGAMRIPDARGGRSDIITMNHAFGDNAFKIPDSSEELKFNTLAYFTVWGAEQPSNHLEIQPVE